MKKRFLKLNKWIEQKKFTKFLIAGLLVLIIITGASILGITSDQRENSISESLSPIPTEIVIPSLTPTPTYVPQKYIKPAYPTPTPDPDPIVTCHERPECGGGITNVKSSVCKAQVCCELNGKYVAFPNSQSCRDAQNASGNSSNPVEQNSTKVPVYLTSFNNTIVYCELNSVDAVKTADGIYKLAGDKKVTCMVNSHSATDFSFCDADYRIATDIFLSVKNKFCSFSPN